MKGVMNYRCATRARHKSHRYIQEITRPARDRLQHPCIEPSSLPLCAELSERGVQMNSYGGKELASAFRTVRKNTIQVAEDIPESKYDLVAAPDCRSVGQMLTHIAIATRIWEEVHKNQRVTTLVGFNFLGIVDQFKAEENKPRSKAEIIELLRYEGEQFASWMETLTPEFLAEIMTDADGKTEKTRFERFLGAKEHEMHHRAQLMLIERQLGIVPHITRRFNEQIAQMRAATAKA
jgi:uncharacterized damage-inducible protein DinB